MNLSISNRTLLGVVVPQLLMALILGAYFIHEQDSRAIFELESRGNQLVGSLAQSIEFPLLSGNREALQRLLFNQLATIGTDAVVIVRDPGQNILAAAGEESHRAQVLACLAGNSGCPEVQAKRLFTQLVTTSGVEVSRSPELYAMPSTAQVSGETVLGSVTLAFTAGSLDKLRDELMQHALLIVAATLLFGLAIAASIARGLNRPVEQLLAVVNRIRNGDPTARTRPLGTGELRQLEEGINQMAAQAEQASSNLNLRVAEATMELSRTLEDLEMRHRELVAARRQAEQANSSKDLFLAKMSHELRTPLATVIGYSRLLQRAEDPYQKQEYSLIMNRAVEILQTTIDDILDFVKLQRDAVQLDENEFDLVQCLENAVAMQVPAAHDKKLEIISVCEDSLPARVYGDSVRLAQIVTNLLNNAIKFTEQGQVTLTASATPSIRAGLAQIRLVVKDSGIGIASDKQAHLFKPFAQADETTNRHFGGSGLGLSIVSRLVESMGGRIGLVSEPGKGTEVSLVIDLPIKAPAPELELPWSDADRVILVHDEHPDVCALIRRLLAHTGCEVFSIPGQEEFTTALHELEPDLVIYAIDVGTDVTEQWERLRSLYSGRLLLIASNERLVADLAEQLPDRESIMVKPLRRDLFRRRVKSLMLGLGWQEALSDNEGPRPKIRASVLVVEDNLLNLRLIMTQLEELGAMVTGVSSGVEALKVLELELPDMVLVDVHMPGMDGITLARRIREVEPNLPVYALTANVIGTEEQQLFEAGVRRILYKPIEEKEILQLLAHKSLGPVEPAPSAPPAPPPATTMLVVTAGISDSEVIAELQTLRAAIARELEAGAGPNLHETIHKLQGVARLFTRGPLIDKVADLARRARADERDAVLAAFREVVSEIDLLRSRHVRI